VYPVSCIKDAVAGRHTSANPPYRVADGGQRHRITKDDFWRKG